MTDTEWSEFNSELLATLPDLYAWLQKSPDMPRTMRVWRKILDGCSIDECRAVLDAWMVGTREPPKAYEREMTATIMRSYILRNRDDKLRRDRLDQNYYTHEEMRRKAELRRKNYKPLPGVLEPFLKLLAIWKRYEDCEITIEECDRLQAEIVANVR